MKYADCQGLLDSMHEAMIVIDECGILEQVNVAAIRLFKYSEEELRGQNASLLLPADNATIHGDYLTKGNLEKEKFVIGKVRETSACTKDGYQFPVELSISEIKTSDSTRYVAMIRDVTEKRSLEAQYKKLIEAMNEALIVIDKNARIVSANPATSHLFGYKQEEMLGKNVSMLMPGEVAVNHDDYVKNAHMDNRQTVIGKTRAIQAIKKNGELFPIELSISELQLNEQIHYAGVIRDASEKKLADEMREEFLAMITHDLRSPVAGIKNALQTVSCEMMENLDADFEHLIKAAGDNCDHVLALINDILDIGKLEAGKLELDILPVVLKDVIQNAMELSHQIAAKFGARVEIVGTIPPILVDIDQGRVNRVINNILTNALKYSPPEGVVEIAASSDSKNVIVSIRDHGIGIPEELIPTIFEKYTQGHGAQTRKMASTGLGLNISRQIIEQHGGEIFCRNHEEGGAVFWFTLPRSQ